MTPSRRTVLAMLAAGALSAAPRTFAQSTPKVARIGVLLYGSPANDPNLRAFRDTLRDLGYVEGKTLTFEYRFAEGNPDRLPALAAELAKQEPHVIFALGGDVAPAARAATTTIPIVMALSNDPVQTQMVASLARPGGNATGVTFVSSDLAGKRLQLLKDVAPATTRVGILWNPDHVDPEYRESQIAARQLGLHLHPLEARRAADFDQAFAAATAARVDAIVVVSSRLMTTSRAQITDFTAKNRIVLVSGWGPWAQHGALLSYGPDLNALVRVAAAQTDKILKGAKPGDVPIEQPTKFHLVINTKTAKTLGLTVPPSVLLRADQILE